MDEYDGLRLDRQLCFALYAASRAVTRLYRPLLDELGLTYPQYLVLLVLWEHGPMTVKDLGAALELDSGTLSPLLKRLESTGLIARSRSADDERSVRIAPTESGVALRDRAKGIPLRVACATGLELAEAADFRDRLRAIAESVGHHRLALDEPNEE
ncbi:MULTISPECIES: MarR family winged helix-turn-helix transcriptional regulator [unclassified Nocardia]|uniref:MarR family winged helix-turn-helix transcriptional regulator n=1 Tax=unclassified Nocardia TaxID=2637762 RepID=UPI001CE443B4|nr:MULTISPECIES: MarR family transcriptional regulator [unclassified Nocardia]